MFNYNSSVSGRPVGNVKNSIENSSKSYTPTGRFLGGVKSLFKFSSSYNLATEKEKPVESFQKNLTKSSKNKVNESIALTIGGSESGEAVRVKKEGHQTIKNPKILQALTNDLNDTNTKYHNKEKQENYLDSFNKDANRGFRYTFNQLTNNKIQQPQNVGYTNKITEDPQVTKAHEVINKISEEFFKENITAREILANNLKGISHQAFFSGPLSVFCNHPPDSGSCIVQGAVSDANFVYSIKNTKDKKEITIKATSSYDDTNNNSLLTTKNNENNELEVVPVGFKKDNNNQSSGTIQGKVSLDIIATIDNDGAITNLTCTSMDNSWSVHQQ
jgi:hypothetical protein